MKFIQTFAEDAADCPVPTDQGVGADGAAPAAPGEREETGYACAPGSAEEKRSLRELIDAREDYKAEYKAMMTEVVRRRLKEQKALESRLKPMEEMIPVLARFYGLEEGDLEGVCRAVKDDTSFADPKKRAGADHDAAQKQAQAQDKHRRATISRWIRQEAALRRIYPSFDLAREMQDPRFAALCHTTDLRSAYESVHRDAINAAMMRYANRAAAERIACDVASNRARPAEGGLAAQAAPAVQLRPRDLTTEQRRNIKNRVRLGERISF